MATQDRKNDDIRQRIRDEVQRRERTYLDPWQRRWEEVERREREEARTRQQRASEELFQAIEDNDPNRVATCLARGANANARGWRVETPLFWAASKDPRITELLLDRGADVNACDDRGRTPLHAAANEEEACLTRLLDQAAGIATSRPGIEQMTLLLDRGADVHARDDLGRTPLHVAAADGNNARLALLLDRGAAIEARDRCGQTPLHDATFYRQIEQMRFLLDRGADVHARDDLGRTPLHIAACCGEEAQLRVLLRAGAEIDARDRDGGTPLFYATIPPKIEPLTYLVSQGADVSLRDARGETPLDVLRVVRGHHALCKIHQLRDLGDDEWKRLRGLLGGFTTVKLLDIWRDSVIIRVESHHGRYPEAEREAKERGTLTVPTNLVFGGDVPEPGQRIRCGKELSPALEAAWSEARRRRDLGIEPVR